MNKFYKIPLLAIMLTGSSIVADGALLNDAFTVNPEQGSQFVIKLQSVIVAYDYELITMPDPNKTLLLDMAGTKYQVYADVYFDEEIGNALGQTYAKNWGNELIIDFSQEAYEANFPTGIYTITIPEGLVETQGKVKNPEQTLTFTNVEPIQPISVSPPDGMYPADELKKIQVTFDSPLTINEESEGISIMVKNDWLNEPYFLKDYSVEGNGKTLTFDVSNILERGINYDIYIPRGLVFMNPFLVNDEIWINYMNWDGLPQAEFISAPNKQSSPELKPFILTWNYQNIKLSAQAPETELICGFPDYGYNQGWRKYIPASDYQLVNVDDFGNISFDPSSESANAIFLDVSSYINIKQDISSQYEIIFPINLVENTEGLDNPSLSYVFNVMNVWPDPQISAENKTITMTWPKASWITYNLENDDSVTITAKDGDTIDLEYTWGGTSPGEVTLFNNSSHGLTINLSNLQIVDGDYVLTVPMGYILLQDSGDNYILNNVTEYPFIWRDGDFADSGISNIYNKTDQTIYDINGRIYKSGEISQLQKGLYIINGKKVLIK